MASLMDLETDIDLPSKRDVDIGRNVGQFWYIIREHIICSQLLFMPGMAASKKATEIDDLGRHGKHLEAADMFLAELKDLKDPGKWESFLKVLKDEGFEYMAEIIEGTVHPDTESAEAYKQLIIEVFGPVIRGKLDAMDLAPSLLEKGLIDNEGMQKLQARNAMDGNLGAVNLLLLSLIWRKKKNWLDIFLQILIENSEEDLAKLIDEKKCAKIKDQLKEKSLRGLTSARENVMFGGGSTFEANPYLCPPSASGGSVTSPGLIGEAESDERTRLKEVMLEGTAPERQELPDPSTQAKRLETEEEEIYRRPVQESGSDGPESFAIGMKPPAHHDLNDVNRNTGGKPPLDDKLTEFNNLSLTKEDDGVQGGETGAESLNDLTCTSSADADRLAESINQLFNVESKEWPTAQKIVSDAIRQDEPDMFFSTLITVVHSPTPPVVSNHSDMP